MGTMARRGRAKMNLMTLADRLNKMPEEPASVPALALSLGDEIELRVKMPHGRAIYEGAKVVSVDRRSGDVMRVNGPYGLSAFATVSEPATIVTLEVGAEAVERSNPCVLHGPGPCPR